MNWEPGAAVSKLQARATMLNRIRDYFVQQNVLEVETPLLASAGVTDPHLINFTTRYQRPGESLGTNLYLQTSPEYAMKRLLCAGSGSIYQICKAFRNEEHGRFHNPEFTMLEWYRVGFDHWQLMDDVEALVTAVLATSTFERYSYQQVFQQHLAFDPLSDSDTALQALCQRLGYSNLVENESHRDTLLQLLFSHELEPKIGQQQPCFIYHFPASQAALAKIASDDARVAERFELYYRGIELANGFHELQSPQEQRRRFQQDNQLRTELGIAPASVDERFLKALEQGLPECAGVALGLDRLLMLITQANGIDEVLSFGVERC